MAKEIILPFSELKGTLVDTPNEPTLEITENGVYNVKGYTYADVNVEGGGGSSDFSTVKVTVDASAFTPEPEYPISIPLPVVRTGDPGIITVNESQTQNIVTYDVALYNGYAIGYTGSSILKFQVVSGNATTSGNGSAVTISGDCSIRFYPTE